MPRRFFVGGNFKMNPCSLASKRALVGVFNDATLDPDTEVVVAPPSLYLIPLQDALENKHISIAAQNCFHEPSGAFTGEIAPAMLHDAGIPWVILGHSERRALFHETSEVVAKKVKAAVNQGLKVILCCGETLEERESGATAKVVESQLDPVLAALKPEQWENVVVAYEPVWAIGTGKVATPEQAQETHKVLRAYLVSKGVNEDIRIIYGGSVNAKNCKELSACLPVPSF